MVQEDKSHIMLCCYVEEWKFDLTIHLCFSGTDKPTTTSKPTRPVTPVPGDNVITMLSQTKIKEYIACICK